jgi:hypothetical protein
LREGEEVRDTNTKIEEVKTGDKSLAIRKGSLRDISLKMETPQS